jgi:hypothetical protein
VSTLHRATGSECTILWPMWAEYSAGVNFRIRPAGQFHGPDPSKLSAAS